jgi:hypothetical protein
VRAPTNAVDVGYKLTRLARILVDHQRRDIDRLEVGAEDAAEAVEVAVVSAAIG